MKRGTGRWRNERGVTLVMVAMMVFMMLGMGALAIDYGMVKSAKAEAQRAADAGALAGASVYLEPAQADVEGVVTARAKEFAAKNAIKHADIDPLSEVVVDPVPAEEKVTVTVTRTGIDTWFAHIFGIDEVGITASATARAAPAGRTPCVKPFALPDLWNENQRNTAKGGVKSTGDTDGDHIWDDDETWSFDPDANPDGTAGDTYNRYDPDAAADDLAEQTGYGSTFRDPTGCTGSECSRDMGRELTIKAQSPSDALGPGFFYLLRLQDSKGANDIKENIKGCAPGEFSIDSTYRIEDGDKKGPVKDAIQEVVGSDPGAYWSPTANGGQGGVDGWDQSRYGSDWRGSPRVIKVGVFDPNQIASISGGKGPGGNLNLKFNNIALLFLEGLEGEGANEVVRARFLYYVTGTGDPGEEGAGGSLVKKLVLIK